MSYGRGEGPDEWAAIARVRSPASVEQRMCFVDCGKAASECVCRMNAVPFHQSDKCPDGGTCHHGCGDTCSRVNSCGPLSNVFPDDMWPAYVLEQHRED